MWSKLLSLFKTDIVRQVGDVVDGLTTSNEEKSSAKQRLTETVLAGLDGVVQAQASVIQTEMKGNWLQRSWRPLVMMTFVVLLVIRWTGLVDHEISQELELKLMSIIELGLGGYVIGRSVEKVAGTVTKNIDMSFLKKKDRK